MKRDWKKERSEAAKHARMMRRKPELREQLYGTGPQPPAPKAETRETAQRKEP